MPWWEKFRYIKRVYFRIRGAVFFSPFFGSWGKGVVIYPSCLIFNPHKIFISAATTVRGGVRLEVINKTVDCKGLTIGKNVNIEQNVHIVCRSNIVIGDNVSIGPNAVILDVSHPYMNNPNLEKIGSRVDIGDTWAFIGDGSVIGAGAIILPKVKIGRFCFIGANAVVTRDIPDFAVAVGSPAKVIKIYDPSLEIPIKFS